MSLHGPYLDRASKSLIEGGEEGRNEPRQPSCQLADKHFGTQPFKPGKPSYRLGDTAVAWRGRCRTLVIRWRVVAVETLVHKQRKWLGLSNQRPVLACFRVGGPDSRASTGVQGDRHGMVR